MLAAEIPKQNGKPNYLNYATELILASHSAIFKGWSLLGKQTTSIPDIEKKQEQIKNEVEQIEDRIAFLKKELAEAEAAIPKVIGRIAVITELEYIKSIENLTKEAIRYRVRRLLKEDCPKSQILRRNLELVGRHQSVLDSVQKQVVMLGEIRSRLQSHASELWRSLSQAQTLKTTINSYLKKLGASERVSEMRQEELLAALNKLKDELSASSVSWPEIDGKSPDAKNIQQSVELAGREIQLRKDCALKFLDFALLSNGLPPGAFPYSREEWKKRISRVRELIGLPASRLMNDDALSIAERDTLEKLLRLESVLHKELPNLWKEIIDRRTKFDVFTTQDVNSLYAEVYNLILTKAKRQIENSVNFVTENFDWIDKDDDGFLTSSELKQAGSWLGNQSWVKVSGTWIDSKEVRRGILRMADRVGEIEELSNDEYLDEDDGIHRNDLAKYKDFEKPSDLGLGLTWKALFDNACSKRGNVFSDAVFKLCLTRRTGKSDEENSVFPNDLLSMVLEIRGSTGSAIYPANIVDHNNPKIPSLYKVVSAMGGRIPIPSFTWEKYNAQALRGYFRIDNTIDTGTDNEAAYTLLNNLESQPDRRLSIRITYEALYGNALYADIESEFSYKEKGKANYFLLRPTLKSRIWQIKNPELTKKYIDTEKFSELNAVFRPNTGGRNIRSLKSDYDRLFERAKTIHSQYHDPDNKERKLEFVGEWKILHWLMRAEFRRENVYKNYDASYWNDAVIKEEECFGCLQIYWGAIGKLTRVQDTWTRKRDKIRQLESDLSVDRSEILKEVDQLTSLYEEYENAGKLLRLCWAKLDEAIKAYLISVAIAIDKIALSDYEFRAKIDDDIAYYETAREITKMVLVVSATTAITILTAGIGSGGAAVTQASYIGRLALSALYGTGTGVGTGMAVEFIDHIAGPQTFLEVADMFLGGGVLIDDPAHVNRLQRESQIYWEKVRGHLLTSVVTAVGTATGIGLNQWASALEKAVNLSPFWATVSRSKPLMHLLAGGTTGAVTDTIGRVVGGQELRLDRLVLAIAQGTIFRALGQSLLLKDAGHLLKIGAGADILSDATIGTAVEALWAAYSKEEFNVAAVIINSIVVGSLSQRLMARLPQVRFKGFVEQAPVSKLRASFELEVRLDNVVKAKDGVYAGHYDGEEVVIRVGDASKGKKVLPSRLRYEGGETIITPELIQKFQLDPNIFQPGQKTTITVSNESSSYGNFLLKKVQHNFAMLGRLGGKYADVDGASSPSNKSKSMNEPKPQDIDSNTSDNSRGNVRASETTNPSGNPIKPCARKYSPDINPDLKQAIEKVESCTVEVPAKGQECPLPESAEKFLPDGTVPHGSKAYRMDDDFTLLVTPNDDRYLFFPEAIKTAFSKRTEELVTKLTETLEANIKTLTKSPNANSPEIVAELQRYITLDADISNTRLTVRFEKYKGEIGEAFAQEFDGNLVIATRMADVDLELLQYLIMHEGIHGMHFKPLPTEGLSPGHTLDMPGETHTIHPSTLISEYFAHRIETGGLESFLKAHDVDPATIHQLFKNKGQEYVSLREKLGDTSVEMLETISILDRYNHREGTLWQYFFDPTSRGCGYAKRILDIDAAEAETLFTQGTIEKLAWLKHRLDQQIENNDPGTSRERYNELADQLLQLRSDLEIKSLQLKQKSNDNLINKEIQDLKTKIANTEAEQRAFMENTLHYPLWKQALADFDTWLKFSRKSLLDKYNVSTATDLEAQITRLKTDIEDIESKIEEATNTPTSDYARKKNRRQIKTFNHKKEEIEAKIEKLKADLEVAKRITRLIDSKVEFNTDTWLKKNGGGSGQPARLSKLDDLKPIESSVYGEFLVQAAYGYSSDQNKYFVQEMGKSIQSVEQSLIAIRNSKQKFTVEKIEELMDRLASTRQKIAEKHERLIIAFKYGKKIKVTDQCPAGDQILPPGSKTRNEKYYNFIVGRFSPNSFEKSIAIGLKLGSKIEKGCSFKFREYEEGIDNLDIKTIVVKHPIGQRHHTIKTHALKRIENALNTLQKQNDNGMSLPDYLNELARAYQLFTHATPYQCGTPAIIESFFDASIRAFFERSFHSKSGEPFWDAVTTRKTYTGKMFMKNFTGEKK